MRDYCQLGLNYIPMQRVGARGEFFSEMMLPAFAMFPFCMTASVTPDDVRTKGQA